MTYKASVLNISACVALLLWGLTLAVNYSQLSVGEGWGVVAMVSLLGFILLAGIVDVIAQQIIKNRTILNVTEVLIVVIVVCSLIFG